MNHGMFLYGACSWLNWPYFSIGSDCQSWFVQKEASRHKGRMVYDYEQYRKRIIIVCGYVEHSMVPILVRKLLHHI